MFWNFHIQFDFLLSVSLCCENTVVLYLHPLRFNSTKEIISASKAVLPPELLLLFFLSINQSIKYVQTDYWLWNLKLHCALKHLHHCYHGKGRSRGCSDFHTELTIMCPVCQVSSHVEYIPYIRINNGGKVRKTYFPGYRKSRHSNWWSTSRPALWESSALL